MVVLLPEHVENAAWRRDVLNTADFLRRAVLRGTFEDALSTLDPVTFDRIRVAVAETSHEG